DAHVHYNLGVVYAVRGDLETAVTEYQLAIEINPDYVLAHDDLAAIYALKGDLEAAVTEYKKAIQINPEYALIYYNLALTYVLKNEAVLSVESLQTAMNLDEETIAKARLDSGFDRIRENPEFQDFIKFKVQEINGTLHRNGYSIKHQND
ncbi:MAG: tetratricopeptide repeat protein, partial [Candidatus Poribacteria bacterium]|nr:tetratricopeptide repeat protein [Candidatus Poribacteria bacterium]